MRFSVAAAETDISHAAASFIDSGKKLLLLLPHINPRLFSAPAMATETVQTEPVTSDAMSTGTVAIEEPSRPHYTWKKSFNDWLSQTWSSQYSDEKVESELLSCLPFFPDGDATRRAKIINTDIGNGNYIHEFFIENTQKPKKPDQVRDIVLVHGYAASLGLFIDNFDDLSSIPGIKIHAIDLLGFGFSSRPHFPKFPSETEKDIHKVEDWFIDSFEQWRLKRNLDRFTLIGHSFGGYLSCAYALKYNKPTQAGPNVLDKLVLVSPVGVERSRHSLFNNNKDDGKQNDADIQKEIKQNQEEVVSQDADTSTDENRYPTWLLYMWKRNYSLFLIIRVAGPAKSKWISGWTTRRFAHKYRENPVFFQNMHNYIYRVFNGKGSGEYALTRVLGVGALAKLPLIDRCPEKFAAMNLPTYWVYGDKDWMNEKAGLEMTKDINRLAGKKLAHYDIISNAGHHVYLDNPPSFAHNLFKFLEM